MRATRDLLRRRMPLMRQRAARLAHVQHTNRQSNWPEIGKKIASKANRTGGAERLPAPAVPKSIAVDLALIDDDDRLLSDRELSSVKTARQHEAHTLSRRQTVPGMGQMFSLVLLYAIHAIQRCPRGQDFVSYCRLVQCATEAAGKRYGTAGKKRGNASLQWALSAAAVLLLRHHAQGQQCWARLENKHGKGQALTVLAHQLARAVSSM